MSKNPKNRNNFIYNMYPLWQKKKSFFFNFWLWKLFCMLTIKWLSKKVEIPARAFSLFCECQPLHHCAAPYLNIYKYVKYLAINKSHNCLPTNQFNKYLGHFQKSLIFELSKWLLKFKGRYYLFDFCSNLCAFVVCI